MRSPFAKIEVSGLAGLGFQYGGSKRGGTNPHGVDIRRVQNRVAVRVGYALPIGEGRQ